jgi:cyclophilin family peptidyl-prolyl cis-trans isomerase
LNEKNTVFGKVIDGFEIIKKLEIHGNANGDVNADVIIEDCGQIGYVAKDNAEQVQPQQLQVPKKTTPSAEPKSKACTIL